MRALVNFDANGVVKKMGEKVSADELEQAGGKDLLGRLVSSSDAEVVAPVGAEPEAVITGQKMPTLAFRVADALAKEEAAKVAAPAQQEEAVAEVGEGFEEPAAHEAIPLSELDENVAPAAHSKGKGKKKAK